MNTSFNYFLSVNDWLRLICLNNDFLQSCEEGELSTHFGSELTPSWDQNSLIIFPLGYLFEFIMNSFLSDVTLTSSPWPEDCYWVNQSSMQSRLAVGFYPKKGGVEDAPIQLDHSWNYVGDPVGSGCL